MYIYGIIADSCVYILILDLAKSITFRLLMFDIKLQSFNLDFKDIKDTYKQ